MTQNELRELLLTLAAEVSAEYDKVLLDRNNKFDDITLLNKRLAEIKSNEEDAVFSPRTKLSSYDAKVTVEKHCSKEKLELAKIDSVLDSLLNRKEELLDGVELLDSVLEERDELSDKVKQYEEEEVRSKEESSHISKETDSEEESDAVQKTEESIVSESSASDTPDSDEQFAPDVQQVLEALSYVAHQCGEIAEHTIQDPYRARNELRAIYVKWGN